MNKPIRIHAHEQPIQDLIFTSDNSLLLTASADHSIRAWGFDSWEYKFELAGHKKKVNKIVIKESDELLISVSNDLSIRFWDIKQRKEILALNEHKKAIITAVISQEESLLATGSAEGEITFWCLESLEKIATASTDAGKLLALSFSPNSTYLLAGKNSPVIELWEPLKNKLARKITTPLQAISSIIHFSRGKKVLLAGEGNAIIVLNTKDWSEEFIIPLGEKSAGRSRIFTSSDKRHLAIVYDHFLEMRWLKTGELRQKIKLKVKDIKAVAFSKDNRFIAITSGKDVLLWEIADLG